jgi:hypothetical protein
VNCCAVAPIGFQDVSLKVIVCAAILRLVPGYIWMGAGCTQQQHFPFFAAPLLTSLFSGDIDLKLGCNVEEFVLRTGAFVGDISDRA